MTSIANITFACEQPVQLSEFWAAALGYETKSRSIGAFTEIWTLMRDPEGEGILRPVRTTC